MNHSGNFGRTLEKPGFFSELTIGRSAARRGDSFEDNLSGKFSTTVGEFLAPLVVFAFTDLLPFSADRAAYYALL